MNFKSFLIKKMLKMFTILAQGQSSRQHELAWPEGEHPDHSTGGIFHFHYFVVFL